MVAADSVASFVKGRVNSLSTQILVIDFVYDLIVGMLHIVSLYVLFFVVGGYSRPQQKRTGYRLSYSLAVPAA